jgi:hypothetical protein
MSTLTAAENELRAHAKAEGYELLLVDRLTDLERRRKMFEATRVALDDPQRGLPTGLRVTLDRGCLFEVEAATAVGPSQWGSTTRHLYVSVLPHWTIRPDRRRKVSLLADRMGCLARSNSSAGGYNRACAWVRALSFDSLAAASATPSRDAWRAMLQSETVAGLRIRNERFRRGHPGSHLCPPPSRWPLVGWQFVASGVVDHWLARRVRWVSEFQSRALRTEWHRRRRLSPPLETVLSDHAEEIRAWGDRTDREFPPSDEIDRALEASEASEASEAGVHHPFTAQVYP